MADRVSLFFDIFAKDRASQTFQKVGKETETLGSKVTTFATRAAGAAALAAGAFAVQGVRGFLAFDDAMNQSLAIMGNISGPMRQRMEDAARSVGKTTRFSASEAAESYFFLASAGLDAEQSVAAMPKVAAFAQAGMFDLATATDLATDAQSALGLSVKDPQQNLANLTRVTDTLVKGNILANASVEQFSESLTNKAGASLRSVNKDVEEGVAVLAAFADQGVKGQRAGEALAISIRDLTEKSRVNRDEFEAMGVAVFDNNGNMRNMADIVADLENGLAGMSTEQKIAALSTLGFTGEAQKNILALLGTSDAIREYEGELRNAAGTTEEVAANQMKSFQARLEIVGSRIADFGLAVGETMVEAAFTVGEHIGEMASILNDLPGPVKIGIAAITGITAAVPVVAGVVRKVKAKHAELMASYRAMSRAGRAATLAMGGVGLALAAGAVILSAFASKKREAKERVEEFTGAIEADSGAMGENTQEAITNQIAKEGLAELAEEAGVSIDTLARAIAGDEEALAALNAEQENARDKLSAATEQGHLAAEGYGEQAAKVDEQTLALFELVAKVNEQAEAMALARGEYELGKEINEKVTEATKENTGATEEHTGAVQDDTGAIGEQVSEIEKLIETLDKATESIFASRDAEVKYEQAVDDAKESLKENGKTLDVTTEKGRKNRQSLDDLAESALDQAAAMLENGESHKKTQRKMADARDEFIRVGRRMGLSREQARKLANQLGLIPGNYEAKVKAEGATSEKNKVKGANRELDKFGRKNKKADVGINDRASDPISHIQNLLAGIPRSVTTTHTIRSVGQYRPPPRSFGRAHGGPVFPGRDFMVGEQGPEIVRFGAPGHVFTASQSRQMLSGGDAKAGGDGASLRFEFVGNTDSAFAAAFLGMVRKGQIRLTVNGAAVRAS